KSSLVCAAIGDLDEHNRHFLPGQANDLGLVGAEPVVKRYFSNSWPGLDEMTRWMQSIGVSVVVMESTGIYWCAAYTFLEKAGIRGVLANAYHVKSVSIHKTDLKDCVWLAVLLRAGFINPSYVPTGHIKDLRDLTRMRARIQKDVTQLKNRCHRFLDTVLVQLALKDVFGKRNRTTLLRALRGEYNELSEEQRTAFESVSESQRMVITELMMNIEELERRLERYDGAIVRVVEKLEQDDDRDVRLLITIPGVGIASAAVIKAEVGRVDRFVSPERLSSYTGLAPRVHQSGNVSMTGRTGKMSNSHLRTTMFLVSQVCARYGPEGLKEFHRRVREKKGYHVATIALARRMMVIIWKMLKEKEDFDDVYGKELLERKKKKYESEVKRLKGLSKSYGAEEFMVLVRKVLKEEQSILIS
ncbi:MAG: IS110 family transposase, partial [Candidatus Thorarchaeota archaeon]